MGSCQATAESLSMDSAPAALPVLFPKGGHEIVTYAVGLGRRLPLAMLAVTALAACQPTVKVEAPKEPITINLNIKLDADVRVKLEESAKQDIKANPNIF